MKALRESCYPGITDVPFGLVRDAKKMPQEDLRSILQPSRRHSFEASGSAIVKSLTKNDKRSERGISTEK